MSVRLRSGEDPIIILGAGPTGLGAAYFFTLANFEDWLIFEASDDVGGLSRSYRDERNFTWDIGGHVIFSHYDSFTKLLNTLLGNDGWLHHARESWIRILGGWVPYPFQNNIHRLPPEYALKCLYGLFDASLTRPCGPYRDLNDFIYRTFGEGIAELFMLPYNSKVWSYPATDLDASWIGDRVATPDLKQVTQNMVQSCDDVSWGPNNSFRFPKFGGTGAIWKRLASRLPEDKLLLRHEVVQVDTDAKVIQFANGKQQKYGTLISSVPLDCLVKFTKKQDLLNLASELKHSSVNVVGLSLKGQPLPDLETKCWMYFPEFQTPFYRVTHFSRYSPNNVDDINIHWSLMAEISESCAKTVAGSHVLDQTISAMVSEGLIDGRDQIEHSWQYRAEYAYPTPFKGRDEIVSKLLIPLGNKRVFSRGRFGAWLYEVGNMDHCFMQGFEAACHVLWGTPEFTVWNPDAVNRPHSIVGWNRLDWALLK